MTKEQLLNLKDCRDCKFCIPEDIGRERYDRCKVGEFHGFKYVESNRRSTYGGCGIDAKWFVQKEPPPIVTPEPTRYQKIDRYIYKLLLPYYNQLANGLRKIYEEQWLAPIKKQDEQWAIEDAAAEDNELIKKLLKKKVE